jgi:hypothetical protein
LAGGPECDEGKWLRRRNRRWVCPGDGCHPSDTGDPKGCVHGYCHASETSWCSKRWLPSPVMQQAASPHSYNRRPPAVPALPRAALPLADKTATQLLSPASLLPSWPLCSPPPPMLQGSHCQPMLTKGVGMRSDGMKLCAAGGWDGQQDSRACCLRCKSASKTVPV